MLTHIPISAPGLTGVCLFKVGYPSPRSESMILWVLFHIFSLILFVRSVERNVTVEANNPLITYKGEARKWYDRNNCGFTKGTTALLDFAEFSFNGTAVYYVGSKGDSGSILGVYLDGALQTTIDRYNPTYICATELWSKTGLSLGWHTLTVRVEATSGPLQKPYLQVKDFIYTQIVPGDSVDSSTNGGNSIGDDTSSQSTTTPSSKLALIGGTIGALLGLAVILGVVLFLRRRRRIVLGLTSGEGAPWQNKPETREANIYSTTPFEWTPLTRGDSDNHTTIPATVLHHNTVSQPSIPPNSISYDTHTRSSSLSSAPDLPVRLADSDVERIAERLAGIVGTTTQRNSLEPPTHPAYNQSSRDARRMLDMKVDIAPPRYDDPPYK